MCSEGNAPRNGEPTVGFSILTMLQHTGRFLSMDFLAKHNVTSLEHPPLNTPDPAPANFYLFPLQKSALKGRPFCNAADIIKNATDELNRFRRNYFQECFQHLYRCRQKCIVSRGNYFEGKVV